MIGVYLNWLMLIRQVTLRSVYGKDMSSTERGKLHVAPGGLGEELMLEKSWETKGSGRVWRESKGSLH